MGSKARIAKHILPIMLQEAEKHGITTWVEPFVGGANMIDKVPDSFKRVGYDVNLPLIAMLDYLSKGWTPQMYTKEDYVQARSGKRELHEIGYMAINCSYSGKWFGGYAGVVKTKGGVRDYQTEARNNVLKQQLKLVGVDFSCASYLTLDLKDTLIYCDPPYKDTTGYTTEFDHESFYEWCRNQAKKNIVFVSEYDAPDDFIEVWSQEVKSSLSANGVCGGNKVSTERLFKVSSK